MVSNFFLYLYDTIFPFVGEIFGKCSALALVEYNSAIKYIFGYAVSIPYVNVFTGVSSTMGDIKLGNIITTLLNPLESLFTAIGAVVPSGTPFILAIIYIMFVTYIGIAIIKFFFNIL